MHYSVPRGCTYCNVCHNINNTKQHTVAPFARIRSFLPRTSYRARLFTRSSPRLFYALIPVLPSASPLVIWCLRSFYSFTASSTVSHHGVGHREARPWQRTRYAQSLFRTTV